MFLTPHESRDSVGPSNPLACEKPNHNIFNISTHERRRKLRPCAAGSLQEQRCRGTTERVCLCTTIAEQHICHFWHHPFATYVARCVLVGGLLHLCCDDRPVRMCSTAEWSCCGFENAANGHLRPYSTVIIPHEFKSRSLVFLRQCDECDGAGSGADRDHLCLAFYERDRRRVATTSSAGCTCCVATSLVIRRVVKRSLQGAVP